MDTPKNHSSIDINIRSDMRCGEIKEIDVAEIRVFELEIRPQLRFSIGTSDLH